MARRGMGRGGCRASLYPQLSATRLSCGSWTICCQTLDQQTPTVVIKEGWVAYIWWRIAISKVAVTYLRYLMKQKGH